MTEKTEFEKLKYECEVLVAQFDTRRRLIDDELGSRLHGYPPGQYLSLSIDELTELSNILRNIVR